LSAIALQKEGIKPKYNVQNWLERERLPDGSWAACNGEVWEASYALRTGEVPNISRLVNVLKASMHPNCWWGFSRYSVPDTDCTSAACYALAPYEPHIASTACENLLSVQHETGGWGTFPQIEGTVPHESVIGKPRTLSNDVTCHVLEVLEQRKKSKSPFKRGISYLLDTQEQDGCWKTTWWRSDIYATTEIALLMYRNGYTEPALHALDWLEKSCEKGNLTIVELALLMKAFSEAPDYSDSLNKIIHQFLERYRSESLVATFDGVHFIGLIDYRVYRLSIIVSSFLKNL
jgi:hypothetical protein